MEMDSLVHIDTTAFDDAFLQLTKFQLDGEFCDVTLKIGDDLVFRAHRVILASKSVYFYTMFTGSLMESKEDTIVLKGVTADAFRELMSYAYTGKIRLRPEVIEELLEAAHMFQFDSVQDACFDFLRNNMDYANCIGIAYLAEKYHCRKAQLDAEEFSRQNFRAVSKTNEFLQLDLEQVIQLVASDELNVTHETEVYTAIIEWVKHDEKSRARFFAELLQYLRVPLLTRKFLIDILAKEDLVMVNPECRRFLLEALDYHLVPERREQGRTQQACPRESVLKNILVIGGESEHILLIEIKILFKIKCESLIGTEHQNARKIEKIVMSDKLFIIISFSFHFTNIHARFSLSADVQNHKKLFV